MSGRSSRHGLVALTLAVLVLLSGCLRMPESGPVVTSDQTASAAAQPGPFIEPAPPAPGESPTEIVRHFFDAMTASSLQTNVARQYLTREAAGNWNPEDRTLTYGELSAAAGTSVVSVTLASVNQLDRRGAWVGRAETTSLTFPVTVEDGEYRIAEAPDALIVPERWFELRFRPIDLYFFDPTGSILVPEPVYVPRGEQFATSAVAALLAGPSAPERRLASGASVIRSFAPSGLAVELSVVVDAEGVARVVLQGDPATIDRDALPLFLAQLTWTLRQDPQVTEVSLTVGGVQISLPDGGGRLTVDFGQEFDPSVAGASSLLFGLRDGVLVRASPGAEEALRGPLGRTPYGVGEVAVDFDANRVAAVTTDRSRVLLTAVDDETASVEQVISGAIDLSKPSWDAHGDLWLLDRAGGSARVTVVADTQGSAITLQGVTGETTRRLVVSRDGSRYAAVVARGAVDTVVVGRISRAADGTPVRGVLAHTVLPDSGETGARISALGWVGPTQLALVQRVTEERDQIRIIGVDGGASGTDLPGTSRMLGTRVTRLVTSPKSDAPIYARTGDRMETPFERDLGAAIDPAIAALTYVG